MASRKWLLAFASLATIGTTQAAFAQESKPAPKSAEAAPSDDIIVTARRKEENLQDVPISITALAGDSLARRGVTDAISLQNAVPSLSVTGNGASRTTLSYAIRGQRTQEVQLLTDPPVGTYFAEVVMPRTFGFGNEFYDLQNIQVLKGVQGTLFGRNMTGGAVLVEPAHPEFGKFGAEVVGQLGNYDMRDILGMVNVPIGDSIALRVVGKHRERDGFTTDIASGRKYDDQNFDTFRASLAIKSGRFTSNTVFDYMLEKENGSALKLNAFTTGNDPVNGFPTVLSQQAGLTAGYPFLFTPNPPIAAGYTPQNLGSIMAADLALPKYTVNYGSPTTGLAGTVLAASPYLYLKNYGITNRTTFEAGPVTFKNIFGYRSINFVRQSDYDGSSANLIYSNQYTRSENYSEEFQMQGKPFGDRFDFTLGAYYFQETGTDGSWSSQFPQLSSMGYAFNIPSLANYFLAQPASFYINHQDAQAEAYSYAVYAAGTYTITPKLKLSGGVRYNNDLRKATITSTQPNFIFPTGPTTAVVGLCSYKNTSNPFENSLANCAKSRSAKFDAVTWDATLTYEPSRDLTAYVAARRGYRAGGFNLRAQSDATFAPFQPETVQEFEVGLKTRNRLGTATLTTSGALFYQDYQNIQKQNAVLINGTVATIVTNTAKEHNWGGELEANLAFDNGLSLNAFMSYVDINNILRSGVTDSGVYPYQGIPKFQAGGAINYGRHFDGLGDFNLNLNVNYKSSTPLDDYDASAIQPGYAIVNGRIDLKKIAGSGFGAAIFANNLFNKYYALGGVSLMSNGPTGLSGGVGYGALVYGEPRTYGVEVSFKF